MGKVLRRARNWRKNNKWRVKFAGDAEDKKKFVFWDIPDSDLRPHLLPDTTTMQIGDFEVSSDDDDNDASGDSDFEASNGDEDSDTSSDL